ncbi:MAG: hypothetical protein Q7K44_00970 [Candidatus Liptonbacteria bacterium]|nr:hypothetical protein [Candidatus Liptonbacteria bacterium]
MSEVEHIVGPGIGAVIGIILLLCLISGPFLSFGGRNPWIRGELARSGWFVHSIQMMSLAVGGTLMLAGVLLGWDLLLNIWRQIWIPVTYFGQFVEAVGGLFLLYVSFHVGFFVSFMPAFLFGALLLKAGKKFPS